jgi:hypothetical protein
MSKAIRLSQSLVMQAREQAKLNRRSPSQQLEYWARLGKLAEDHSDLSRYQLLEDFNAMSLNSAWSLNRLNF